MGTHTEIYFGPYLKIINPKINWLTIIKCCQNSDCKQNEKENKKDNFCPDCGTQITIFSTSKFVDFNIYDVLKEHENDFFMPEHIEDRNNSIVLYNKEIIGLSKIDIDGGIINLENIDSEFYKNVLEDMAKQPIKVLRDYLGDDNVIVKFGIIVYWT